MREAAVTSIDDVMTYWFGEPASDTEALERKFKRWYLGGTSEDAVLVDRFGAAVEQALLGALDSWAQTPRGRVALVLLLDQMTRSVFRDRARAFDGDPRAQKLAVEALDAHLETQMSFEERQFLLMPLLHAESVPLLERFCVEVRRHVDEAPAWAREMLSAGLEQGPKYLEVVTRFGRFPHRNQALGRVSTPEERTFLEDWTQRAKPRAAEALLQKR